jgi:peptide methionine sulfoxide reductase MsrB
MPAASSKGVMLVTMTGMGVILCGGLVVLMQYVKTEYRRKAPGKPAAATAPAGPYEARFKDLRPEVYGVVRTGQDQPGGIGANVTNTQPGIYADVISGDALFSSLDKLESVFGYAEFSRPLDASLFIEKEGKAVTTGEDRLQVYSKPANCYLGWIVKDQPSGARRYVINSNALDFVPLEDLEKRGLGKHRGLFAEKPGTPPEKGTTP